MIYTLRVEFTKEFLEVKDNHISIDIKSKPIKGEANKELIKKIARHFQISSSRVTIKKDGNLLRR